MVGSYVPASCTFLVATDLVPLTLHFELCGDRHTQSPGKRESQNGAKILTFSLITLGITMGPIQLVSLQSRLLFSYVQRLSC